MDILKLVKEKEERVIKIRRDLHQIPELELELPKTMEYISKVLDEIGVKYKKLLNGNAIVAQIDGEQEGKCIAIRADSDALPVVEETGLPFASTNGNMHACGHDGHTAMALGACMILNENRDKLKGTVKIFFQPGEESPGGALPMIEEGCMENPKVDAVIGLHEGCLIPIKYGKIGVKAGAIMASADVFEIYVKGKSSHAATPHLSADPIVVSSEIVLGLQKIVSREVNPISNAVLTIGIIQGGTAHNVIPETVYIKGTVRTLDEKVREFIAKRVEEIADGIAKTYGCTAETIYHYMYPVVMNDEKFTEFFIENTKEILGEDSVEIIKDPSMGGEDVAYFLQRAKGTYFMLSNPKMYNDDTIYPHHHSKFDVEESLFYKGMSAVLATVFKYLS